MRNYLRQVNRNQTFEVLGRFSDRHPFNEIIGVLQHVVSDGIVDPEECADILWNCAQFESGNDFYDSNTSDMQRLQGVMRGIVADGVINEDEIRMLDGWMAEREYLRSCWPYDELESIITKVMADGRIDDQEHAMLLAFFAEFVNEPGHRAIALKDSEQMTISGVCALDPEIVFPEKKFCFTGSSKRATKSELAGIVDRGGGIHSKGATKDLSYLVVGAEGNSCWAMSVYGRKVETVIKYRKKGSPTLIVHELDFWDSAESAELA